MRDMGIKAKRLRKEGFLPASLGGRNMEKSLSISISEKDAKQFMKDNVVGSKAILDIEGTTYNVLLKSADFDPFTHQFLEMTFQQLIADEKVKTKAEIILLNEDKARGFITRTLSEIEYKAYPADLVDKIEIDVSEYPIGTNLTVADLDIAKNENVDMLSALESTILHIAEHAQTMEEEPADDESASPLETPEA